MNTGDVQTLVLRAPPGPAVRHLILQVPPQCGRAAACLLERQLDPGPSFGLPSPGPCCSVGFSFAGLQALALPEPYLRLFQRLAPAFAAGAVRRSAQLGDSGASAPFRWLPMFGHEAAHVLVSWHGDGAEVQARAQALAREWQHLLGVPVADALEGRRLGHPPGQQGEWVHYGYRDDVSEVCIDEVQPQPGAPDLRRHAPGALLLGHVNDAGFDPCALTLNEVPEKVRDFFRDSSFGILRPMRQDIVAFEAWVAQRVTQLQQEIGPRVDAAFVKAKLCGRWPDGRQVLAGEWAPGAGTLALDLSNDGLGTGCPFGSHVRRLRATADGLGRTFVRPLQRRGVPFGDAAWSDPPADGKPRGLIGQFFCAGIEDQFEHLLGQWAARPPLGAAPGDDAPDPLIGPHEDPAEALELPQPAGPARRLDGFRTWTTTLGTMYAWHPGRSGLTALLQDDFVPEEDEGPWP